MRLRTVVRSGAVTILAAALVLALARTACAERASKAAPGQAIAEGDVLRLRDLPPAVKWTTMRSSAHGPGTPAGCSGAEFDAKGVLATGQATTQFQSTPPGLWVINVVGITASPRMIGDIWRHTFTPGLTRCLDDAFTQGARGRARILSVERLPLPRLAADSSAYRAVFQLDVSGHAIRGAFDLVGLAAHKTFSLLIVMGILGTPSEQAAGELDMTVIDLRLSETIAGRAFRAHAGTALSA